MQMSQRGGGLGGKYANEGVAETNLDAPSSALRETAFDGESLFGSDVQESGDEGDGGTPRPRASSPFKGLAEVVDLPTVDLSGDFDHLREDPTYTKFAAMFFSEIQTIDHQRSPLSVPLLKQVWGDGDAHRALVCWTSLLFFIGDTKARKGQEKLTNLNAIHVITNTGMTRPNTRDEIYCQIFKQILDNPNRHSQVCCLLPLLFLLFSLSLSYFICVFV